MTDLFDSFDLKGISLSNRIVMSAMTRTRASDDDVPTDVMRDYYVQRASAGLIVTECTQVAALLARSFALAIIASTLACAPARKSTSPRITPDTSDVFVQT